MAVDLHIHTNVSDGIYSPEEIVAQASREGLEAIAITDHDSIDAIAIAQNAAKHINIEIIPGIEISAEYNGIDVHILGYFVDITKQKFLTELTKLNSGRKERAIKIISKLFELGIKIELEEVIKISTTASIGRPHIAKAMLEFGFVRTEEEAFSKYIGLGRPAYIPLKTINPLEAIRLILSANGVPVLAHPGVNQNSVSTILEELIVVGGLKGIEVYHPDHNSKQIKLYTKIAKKNNLIITGGTDFHGGRGNKHSNNIGAFSVSYKVVEELKQVSLRI
jgi:predicted metal-dependent phosphoesterase TrpH